MNEGIQTNQNHSKRSQALITGLILILIGLFSLAVQYIKVDWIGLLILPGLGLIFLAWGLIVREVGLLIPGGILSGIGLSAYLLEGPFSGLDGSQEGGIFFLSFALGWGLITVLSAVIRDFQWWPLIPGGIMAGIGSLLMLGEPGLKVLELIGKAWPLALIAVGLYLAFWRRSRQQ